MTLTVVAWTALGVGAINLVLIILLLRQSADALTQIRKHRTGHQRTWGRPDPDPEHHQLSPTVQQLVDEHHEMRDHVIALTTWAQEAEDRIVWATPDAAGPPPAPTQAMPAVTARPRPEADT